MILGWGPFFMMAFVEGIGVDDILQHRDSRLLREDVSERVIESLFRQMIDFSLQLQNLYFPLIGSLTSESIPGKDGFAATIHSRPVTKKSHDFLLDSGVDVRGPQNETSTSTNEYFLRIIERDLQHLHDQLNSVDDESDAREKYIYFNIMKALVPRHVLPGLDRGPFKLRCDDFQPTNMIVNNEQELKVIAVIDWEWSYTAPAQMANSTPSWPVIQSPHIWATVDDRLTRFNKHLEIYTRILEEEEPKILRNSIHDDYKPSTILRATQENGLQWFHTLILRGFNGPTCVPFINLREKAQDRGRLASAIPEEDIDLFVKKKMNDFKEYEKQLAEMEARYKIALEGNLDTLNTFLGENEKLVPLDSERRQWKSWACFHQ